MKPGYTPIEENQRFSLEDKVEVCVVSTLCMLGNFFMLFCRLLIFCKINYFEKKLRVSKSLDPDQAQHFVGPELFAKVINRRH